MRNSFLMFLIVLLSNSILAESNTIQLFSDSTITSAKYLNCGSRKMENYQNVIVERQEVLDEFYKIWGYDQVCIRYAPKVDFTKHFYVIAGGFEYGCPSEFKIHAYYRIEGEEILINAKYYVDGTCRGPQQPYFSLIAIPKELSSYQINTQIEITNKAYDKPPK